MIQLATITIDQIRTQADLRQHAMTPEQAHEELERYQEPHKTNGIGKNKGRTYLTGKVLALNANGDECRYTLCINDLGDRTIRSDCISRRQGEAWKQEDWANYPQYIQQAVLTHFPACENTYQRVTMASVLAGDTKPGLSPYAVLGNWRNVNAYLSLFPEDAPDAADFGKGVDIKHACNKLYNWAQTLKETT